jgi:hypothetical protein
VKFKSALPGKIPDSGQRWAAAPQRSGFAIIEQVHRLLPLSSSGAVSSSPTQGSKRNQNSKNDVRDAVLDQQ